MYTYKWNYVTVVETLPVRISRVCGPANASIILMGQSRQAGEGRNARGLGRDSRPFDLGDSSPREAVKMSPSVADAERHISERRQGSPRARPRRARRLPLSRKVAADRRTRCASNFLVSRAMPAKLCLRCRPLPSSRRSPTFSDPGADRERPAQSDRLASAAGRLLHRTAPRRTVLPEPGRSGRVDA